MQCLRDLLIETNTNEWFQTAQATFCKSVATQDQDALAVNVLSGVDLRGGICRTAPEADNTLTLGLRFMQNPKDTVTSQHKEMILETRCRCSDTMSQTEWLVLVS